jgi:2-dehydro-3-deoxyphosphogluconate aldolase/(4S)-4-hydroxy-2-oxoglutarate aldolase
VSEEALERLAANRLLPVVVIDDSGRADGLARSLAAGGLPAVEVTLRTEAAFDAIGAMAERGDVLVGAGSVLTAAQADQAAKAGARFAVSPGLSRAVVERCQELGLAVVPGVATATEVQAALELGLGVLKFFPAGASGGPVAIKALGGPFPQIRFVPTGGIGLADLAGYLSLPNVAAVGGSWIAPRDAISRGDWRRISELAAQAAAAAAPPAGHPSGGAGARGEERRRG